jgi:ribosomal protein S8
MKQSTINLLINLKNVSQLKKEFLEQNFYLNNYQIIKTLYKEGFIQSIKIIKTNTFKRIRLIIRFFFNKPIINKLNFFSKPSFKTFIKAKQLKKLTFKKTALILSTSKGLMTNVNCIKKKIGGVLLFSVK